MNILKKVKDVYKDHPREIQYKVDSLFILHYTIIAVLIGLSVVSLNSGQMGKVSVTFLIILILIFSLIQANKGRFEFSATTLSASIFIFFVIIDLGSKDTEPFRLYKTALMLSTAAMMSSLLVSKIRTVYIFTLSTLIVLVYDLLVIVIPGNPDLPLSTIIINSFLYVILLLAFIAHFVFKKHRITMRILKESNALSIESKERADHIKGLLEEVQKSIGITTGLLTEVDAIHNKVSDTNMTLDHFSKDMSQFSSSFKESSSSLSEIGTEIEGLNSVVSNQATAQEQSAAATNEMVSSINSVAQIVEKKVDAAERLIETTTIGGQKLEDTVNIIQAISSRVDAIMEMVELINNIASNTNLLSMNAAIEAAHAGEAGKGFAVVAEEIRKLAEESSTNADSIAKVLKEVVDNIRQSYEFGVSTQEAYNHILNDVKETSSAFQEISSTTNELNAGTREILISLSELTDLTKDVRSATGNISESQVVIEEQLSQTGHRIIGIEQDIDHIIKGNDEIEEAIKNINSIAETLKLLNESLK